MKETKSTHRAHAFYSGRVQGVGFRHEAESVAHRLGLMGWVKNLQDGRVELVCEGSKEQIEKLFSELQDGALGRFIKKVDCVWEPPTNEYKDFCVEFCY
jgi:acylphosphatase